MNEELFEKYFQSIQKTIKFALNNPCSDFYRLKYKDLDFDPLKIGSYNDFSKLPLLTRNELVKTRVQDRYFLPEKKIKRMIYSSGTTGDNPLVMTRNDSTSFEHADNLIKLGVKKIMLLTSSTGGVLIGALTNPAKGLVIIPGDVNKLAISALIAKELGIESMRATPTTLRAFTGYLEKEGFDFKTVKAVILGSEFTTRQILFHFKDKYPKAKFLFGLGSTETAKRGYRCADLENAYPWIYHPVDRHYLEIDKSNIFNTKHFRSAGQILYTDLISPKPFPLIRYNTCDIGFLEKKRCSCGNNLILGMAGRFGNDCFKYGDFSFHTQDIADSLQEVGDLIEPVFQMVVGKADSTGGEILDLLLKISAKDAHDTRRITNLVHKTVSENLNLMPDKNIKTLVAEKKVMPIRIENVLLWPEGKTKSLNIISEVEK